MNSEKLKKVLLAFREKSVSPSISALLFGREKTSAVEKLRHAQIKQWATI